jgi:DMSO/TMAO reductase YedYZ molybdopterin-dependent catalytic subunit
MNDNTKLPPGQYELDKFPRFGLSQFANRFPKETDKIQLKIDGNVENPLIISDELKELPRIDQISDFHCVTTWTRKSLCWSGFRFSDFFHQIVVPKTKPKSEAVFVIFRCQDGYMSSLPLADLLADTVILADSLDGNPLTIEHGAPLRLVAPDHYGYKNAKHLRGIEFWVDNRKYKTKALWFMDHPRARVALEERGRGFPGWLLRYLYRPLVLPTIWLFRRALDRYLASKLPPN